MNKVSRKLLIVWNLRLGTIFLLFSLIVLLLIPNFPFLWIAVFGVVSLIVSVRIFPLMYGKLEYSFEDFMFIFKSGVFSFSTQYIPAGTVERTGSVLFIKTRSFPLERKCGIVSLLIYSAGSVCKIPGLTPNQADEILFFFERGRQ